jgi:hypothetical protein
VVVFGGVMDFAAALFSWWIATGYTVALLQAKEAFTDIHWRVARSY